MKKKLKILTQRRKDAEKFSALLRLCVLFLFLFLFACSKKEEKIPADIIPKDSMVQIMVDIHLAEAQSQFNVAFENSINVKQAYYKFIFEKHKISYANLIHSWEYYTMHPAIFTAVYEDVITELSKKQAAVNEIKTVK